jgi:alpha-N-acetylglucosamine transferase
MLEKTTWSRAVPSKLRPAGLRIAVGVIILLTIGVLHNLWSPSSPLISLAPDTSPRIPEQTHPEVPLISPTSSPEETNTAASIKISPSTLTDLNRDVSTEKYITLLAPPSPHSWDEGHADFYWETATIMAHRLLHHPETKDPLGRGFIVLATHDVKPKQIKFLEDLGADVRVVDSLRPPSNVDTKTMRPRWKDQFTKLLMWNMTDYTRIVYIDADSIIVKQISELFDVPPAITLDGEEWLFAGVYDAAPIKGWNKVTAKVPELGPDDKWGWSEFSAGQFLLMPSQAQSEYIFSIYNNPPDGTYFTETMEQSLLRYAYRDEGPYPWIRLSQIYNTQWPRLGDIAVSKIIHEKSWVGGPNHVQDIMEEWHRGWGDVQGYLALKQGMDEYAQEAHPITSSSE